MPRHSFDLGYLTELPIRLGSSLRIVSNAGQLYGSGAFIEGRSRGRLKVAVATLRDNDVFYGRRHPANEGWSTPVGRGGYFLPGV